MSAGTAGNRVRNGLGAGKGPPLKAGNKRRSQAEPLPGSTLGTLAFMTFYS